MIDENGKTQHIGYKASLVEWWKATQHWLETLLGGGIISAISQQATTQ